MRVCVLGGGGGQGVQQTDLVIKGLEIASHHGGSGYKNPIQGGLVMKMMKGLEIARTLENASSHTHVPS